MLVHFMTMWSILQPFRRFCGHLLSLIVIWYIFPVLVRCTKKNLATLARRRQITSVHRVRAYVWNAHE
jgi:hypothetical protein